LEMLRKNVGGKGGLGGNALNNRTTVCRIRWGENLDNLTSRGGGGGRTAADTKKGI